MVNVEVNLLDQVQAVLFDMDGVVIDGMPYHAQAWQKTFGEIGLSISAREVYEREGESGLSALAAFLEKRGLKPGEDELRRLMARKEAIFKEIVQAKPFDGIDNLLETLQARGKRLALVTGTARHELMHSLPEVIREKFEFIVTGDEVKQGKPDPEPYQRALDELGLKAGDVVVIENAPLGIRAAKQAGCHCLAVATSLPPDYLREADACFESLATLSHYLLA